MTILFFKDFMKVDGPTDVLGDSIFFLKVFQKVDGPTNVLDDTNIFIFNILKKWTVIPMYLSEKKRFFSFSFNIGMTVHSVTWHCQHIVT